MALSILLDRYLEFLFTSSLQVKLKALSYDSGIPEDIILRLAHLHRHPEDAPNIHCNDYYIIFSNLMFRYPTVRIWRAADGSIFFSG